MHFKTRSLYNIILHTLTSHHTNMHRQGCQRSHLASIWDGKRYSNDRKNDPIVEFASCLSEATECLCSSPHSMNMAHRGTRQNKVQHANRCKQIMRMVRLDHEHQI